MSEYQDTWDRLKMHMYMKGAYVGVSQDSQDTWDRPKTHV